MLKEKLQIDLKEAMRAKDVERLSTLRMANAAIGNWEIEQRGKGNAREATDEDIIAILRKETKKRREAEEAFHAGGREELARKEEREAKILSAYLPAQLSDSDIRLRLEKIAAGGVADFGALMREGMKELRGNADASAVSRIAKDVLLHGEHPSH